MASYEPMAYACDDNYMTLDNFSSLLYPTTNQSMAIREGISPDNPNDVLNIGRIVGNGGGFKKSDHSDDQRKKLDWMNVERNLDDEQSRNGWKGHNRRLSTKKQPQGKKCRPNREIDFVEICVLIFLFLILSNFQR